MRLQMKLQKQDTDLGVMFEVAGVVGGCLV